MSVSTGSAVPGYCALMRSSWSKAIFFDALLNVSDRASWSGASRKRPGLLQVSKPRSFQRRPADAQPISW